MLTNLIASVVITLVTNTVATDNAKWERDPFMSWPEGGGPMRVVKEATERYVTTAVTEHTEVTVPIRGTPHTFTDDHLLSSVTKIMQKLEEWREQGTKTNQIFDIGGSPNPSTWIVPTNNPIKMHWLDYDPQWNLDVPSSGVTNHVGVMP